MQTIACCVLNGKFSSVVGGMAGENNSTECLSERFPETLRTPETPETPETPIFISLLDQKPPIFLVQIGSENIYRVSGETPHILYSICQELWCEDR